MSGDIVLGKNSLVTVTHNSAAALRTFWGQYLAAPGATHEWIVVDNASNDGSAELAESLGARVIRLPENVGFSAANNVGLESSTGEVVGFVNPDVRVDTRQLPSLAALARETGGLIAPQLLNVDGTLQPNGRGYPLLSAKIRNRLKGGDLSYLLYATGVTPRPVAWVMGAAVFAERAVFDRIGGWDPKFFLYYEDKDLCLRAWHAGVPVLVDPTIRWTHEWARATKGMNFVAWCREIASMTRFYGRYPEFLQGERASIRDHQELHRSVHPTHV